MSWLQGEDCGARDDVLRWGDGFMLVYSVVSRKSFDALQEVKRRIEDAKKGSPAPILMVGNKCDLAHMRQVTKEEGRCTDEFSKLKLNTKEKPK